MFWCVLFLHSAFKEKLTFCTFRIFYALCSWPSNAITKDVNFLSFLSLINYIVKTETKVTDPGWAMKSPSAATEGFCITRTLNLPPSGTHCIYYNILLLTSKAIHCPAPPTGLLQTPPHCHTCQHHLDLLPSFTPLFPWPTWPLGGAEH